MNDQQPPDPHPLQSAPISPELIEWARQQFSEEEYLEGIREIEQTGGHRFEDFIHELEEKVKPRG